MKKLLSTILLFGFVLLFPTLFEEQSAEAASKTMYVNAKNDIILRAEPSQQADRLGTIKNHSAITVLSSSNGWSYVQTGKTKGYVYTIALSNKKPVPTINGGLIPQDGLKLTYSPSILSNKKETFVTKEDEYGGIALLNVSSKGDNFYYQERDAMLSMGVYETDWGFFDFTYPMKQGSYIKNIYFDYESDWPVEKYNKVLVESTTKTIKVKAGTFKNVVILRYHPTRERYYFAKSIGLIKATDKNGKIVTELTSVK